MIQKEAEVSHSAQEALMQVGYALIFVSNCECLLGHTVDNTVSTCC